MTEESFVFLNFALRNQKAECVSYIKKCLYNQNGRLFFFHVIRIPVLQWWHADMLFHELPEERWIGKVEIICHFFHAPIRVLQFVLDLNNPA